MKFLIGILSPREIPEVQDAIKKIDFVDKFIVKYTRPERLVYKQIEEFFLAHDYNYLILWSDDLLVYEKQLKMLMMDCESFRPEVIGGVCNIDTDNEWDSMAIQLKPFNPDKSIGTAFRYYEKFSNYYDSQGLLLPKYHSNPIIRTRWQGFPLTAIRRDVFDDIHFRDSSEFNSNPLQKGCCTDDVFCWDCMKNEIPMWTDLRINMKHLKVSDENSMKFFVKNKKPYSEFIESESEKIKKVEV